MMVKYKNIKCVISLSKWANLTLLNSNHLTFTDFYKAQRTIVSVFLPVIALG